MNVLTRVMLTVMLVAISASFALAVDPPHDPGRGITCANCHYSGSTINTVGYTNLCHTCHQPNGMAQMKPFSPVDAANIFGNITTKRTGTIMNTSHNWGGRNLVVPKAGAVQPVSVALNYAPLIGLSCERCHNIHNPAQSANNSAPFLRMLNNSDQMCLDCHSPRKTTNHVTGSHPVTMTYTSAIKKFARYTTKFYTTPVNANPSNRTSALNLAKGGQLLCSTCHGVHYTDSNSTTFDNATSSVLGRLKPSDGSLLRTDRKGATANATNICTNCHKGYVAHNGKGQNVQCADCHGAHVDEADGSKSNVWLIQRYMTYSTALTGKVSNRKLLVQTIFTSTTSKNYRDGRGTGVCQSCHALPTTVAEHSQAGVDCNSCHYHGNPTSSFAAPSGPGGCTSCHGQPPTVNVAGGPNGYATGYTRANEALTAHGSHVGTYSYTCNDCHKGNTHLNNNFSEVFVTPAGTTAAANGATPTYNVANLTCATTYCHSNGAPRGGVIAYPAAVAWANGKGSIIGTAGECAACHGSAATLSTNVHSRHVNPTTGKAFSCEVCHATVATGSTAIANKTLHANATKDVAFSGIYATGASFNTTTATCATSCHSNGYGAAPITVPNWTATASGACGTCHNAANTTLATYAHTAHLNSASAAYGPATLQATAAAGSCQTCHTSYTANAASHVNGAIDVAYATCNPCHVGTLSLTTWRGGRLSCESCHVGTTRSVIQGATAPDQNLSASKGHTQATFTGAPNCQSCHNANSAHISGVIGDNVRLTLANTNAQCASCHNNAAKIKPAFFNMSTHFSVKGGPQDMLCKTCHDPHGTTNLSMIRTQLKGAWANATTYTIVYTDANSGFVNTATNRGLCQVCHTKTNHYKAGVAETNHPTSGCLGCHGHNNPGGAFKPTGGGACDSCHGYPPMPTNVTGLTFGTTGNFANAKFQDYSGGGGAHFVPGHVKPTAVASEGWTNCTPCHNGGSLGSTPNHLMTLPLKTNIANVTVQVDQKYRFTEGVQITYSSERLVSPGNKTGTCSNVECHFQPSRRWSSQR